MIQQDIVPIRKYYYYVFTIQLGAVLFHSIPFYFFKFLLGWCRKSITGCLQQIPMWQSMLV
jgi:hypothetical protein